jgi:hypothetical protein
MTEYTQADREAALAKFAVGTSWRSKVLGKSKCSDLIHVRGHVDDQIVYRWWRYHKTRCTGNLFLQTKECNPFGIH